jgi:hypothetical protein
MTSNAASFRSCYRNLGAPLIISCIELMAVPSFILGLVPSAPIGVIIACFCA